MTKIKDITRYLETIAPLSFQESYDNAGLQTGDGNTEVTGVLLTLDCTEEVVDEAIANLERIKAKTALFEKPFSFVTTQKDAVKLTDPGLEKLTKNLPFFYLPIEVSFFWRIRKNSMK